MVGSADHSCCKVLGSADSLGVVMVGSADHSCCKVLGSADSLGVGPLDDLELTAE